MAQRHLNVKKLFLTFDSLWNLYKDFCVHLFLVNDHEADVLKPGQVKTARRAHKYRYMGEAREVLIYSY